MLATPIRTAAALEHSPARPQSWLAAGANLEPRFGGISSVIGPLCEAVQDSGDCRITLASFGARAAESVPAKGQLDRRDFSIANDSWLPGSQSWRSLAAEIRSADGVHIHGIWQKHCALTAYISRQLRKPYLISAHGMLDKWALGNKRLKKIVYSALIEKRNLRRSACLHALTEAEAADYRKLARSTPVAVIPNGVAISGGTPGAFLEKFPELHGKQIVLFLGRIHYKKGLDILCRAWAAANRGYPDAQLVLAGPDFENTRSRIEALVDELGIRARVVFTGMLSGNLKWSALAAATLFVLPSYSEGLSVSVLEALGMGLPVIISRQCNLTEVSRRECGWLIEPVAHELEAALREALSTSRSEHQRMGQQGRELIHEKYSWPVVGAQMASVYRWVLGGSRPDCVDI